MDCVKIIIFIIFTLLGFSQNVPFYNIALTEPEEIKVLNSEFRETNLSLSPDGKTMYFMSTRGEQPWSRTLLVFKNKIHYDGDIWKAERINNQWQKPQCLPFPINTQFGEDEPIVINDSTLIYQSWRNNWQTTGGPYYILTFHNDTFSLQGLNSGITQFFIDSLSYYNQYATDGAYISPNNKIFFVSANNDYNKNMDIYLSQKINNKWTYLKKSNISTPGDERSIFITKNGKFIFFASNSYNTLGGYDIFVAELDTSTGYIYNVKNLGPPINTPQDEYSFIINPANEKEAFFVRNGNIYTVKIKNIETIPPIELYFNFDDTTITSPKTEINKLINYSKSAKQIVIIGHTDTIGTNKYNAILGLKRAKHIKNILINSGIPENKIITLSNGENNPKYPVDEKNRRVEIILKY